MTQDDCFNRADSVHADDLAACHDPKLAAASGRGTKEMPPKPPRYSRVGRTYDEKNAVAALQRFDSGSARGAAVAGDDEIDRSDHLVRFPGTASPTTMGALNVRKNASICRNSAGFSLKGLRSLCPVAAAGARL